MSVCTKKKETWATAEQAGTDHEVTSGNEEVGLYVSPIEGQCHMENATVVPVDNRGCPVPMLEAGSPLLGLNYSSSILSAPKKKLLLSVMFGVNKAKQHYKLNAVCLLPAQPT